MFQTFTGQVSPVAPIGTNPVDISPKRAKRMIAFIMRNYFRMISIPLGATLLYYLFTGVIAHLT